MMDEYTISELSYKNGYMNGEIGTRIKLAYEQLAKVHTLILDNYRTTKTTHDVSTDVRDAMNRILDIQVRLGLIKREEDLK